MTKIIRMKQWKMQKNTEVLLRLCEDTNDMLDEAMELLEHYPHRRDEIVKRIEGWCCHWNANELDRVPIKYKAKPNVFVFEDIGKMWKRLLKNGCKDHK